MGEIEREGIFIPDGALDLLPVFPLPNTILFPGMALPLHVFEQRYRELVAHCLEGSRALGVAMLQPGFEEDYEGQPPIYPVMGAGVIVAEEELDDGRWNIIVQGTDRVRLLDELPLQRSFRLLRVERLHEMEDGDTPAAAQTLRGLLRHLMQEIPDAREPLARLLADDLPPGRMADLVAASTFVEPESRQIILEELRVSVRLRQVTAELAERYLGATDDDGGSGFVS